MIKLSCLRAVVFVCLLLFSCSLDSFELDKLAVPTDIMPDVYAPLAYGTYKVDDLVDTPKPKDGSTLPPAGLPLTVNLDKSNTSFRSSAVDSVYLMINIENKTHADMVFKMQFINSSGAGLYNSSSFTINSFLTQSSEIPLGPTEQDYLRNAVIIKLIYTFVSPDSTPLLYSDIKDDLFSVQVSFHAPVDLGDL